MLEPNYRGSTGYGEKFRNLNVEDSGGGEMDDVAAGAEYLVKQGLADPKRLGHRRREPRRHDGRLCRHQVSGLCSPAAIEMYGVVDRATFNERTNRNSAIRWMMKMGGTPDEKPEVYRKANTLAGRGENQDAAADHARRKRPAGPAVRIRAVRQAR